MMKKPTMFDSAFAGPGVDHDRLETPARRRGAFAQRRLLLPLLEAAFLDFERRLPEKQIRTDRRPQHRDHHDDEIALCGDVRDECGLEYFAPGQRDAECCRHIGKQHQRQDLHVPGVGAVRDEDLCREADHAERQRKDHGRAADEEPNRFPHGGDVGGNIDDIGGGDQRDNPVEQRRRQHFPEIGGEAAAGDGADARADDLDRDHERGREKHRPAQRVAELGSGLRVGRDAARIVVRRPRQQARTQQSYQSFQRAVARHSEAFRRGMTAAQVSL
jgi:hypothetical protein